MVDKTTVIKAGSAGSSVLPAIAIIGVGYLGYKALSGVGFGGITGGIAGGITERIESFSTNIKDSTKVVYDNVNNLNDGMNDNYITNLFALDIQRKEDMTDAQKWSLSELKKGNVNYNTISGGKLDKNASIFDIVKNAWSKETLANTQIMFLPKGKDKPLSFLATDSVTTSKPDSSLNVSSIKNSVEAFSAGLGNAPLAVNANPSNLGGGSPTKYKSAYAKAVAEGNVISWKNPDNKRVVEPMGSGDKKIAAMKRK